MQTMLNDFQGDLDMANLRTVSLPNGTLIKINRTDPYGLINIEYQGKKTPEELSGAYTTFEQAKTAINNHLTSKSKKK